jgi:hypothetical protein
MLDVKLIEDMPNPLSRPNGAPRGRRLGSEQSERARIERRYAKGAVVTISDENAETNGQEASR